ncbi:MAG: tRNA lysidine(34) synthetase TilS [bacterium]
MLLKNINKTIQKNNLIQKGDRVIVAVSGGPDSVALLLLLNELKKEYNLNLFVVHLNHQFRGKEADADARFVQSLARNLNLPCFVKSVNVPEVAKKKKKSPEEMAREIRYAFLQDIAQKEQANKIALGHNADDQTETILMWLLRGAGIEGLAGMEIARKSEVPNIKYQVPNKLRCSCQNQIYIIRPLLETSRKEILEYLKEKKQKYRVDKTNLKPIYLRNRIRNNLIPQLEKEYNPNLKETLLRTATILRDELTYFESAAEMILACIRNRERTDCFAINLSEFRHLDRAIHRHLIRQSILQVCGTLTGIGFDHIEAILELAKSGGDGLMLHLPGQVTVRIEQDELCFYLGRPKKDRMLVREPIAVPGTTTNQSFEITITTELKKITAIDKNRLLRLDRFTAVLDADKLQFPLTLRNWQMGDTFIPLGMTGKKKLHDFYIDEKIPRTQRDKVPLLIAGNGNIVWVVGQRIDERYKITQTTKRVLRIRVVKS